MLCQNCNKNVATAIITKTFNGQTVTKHLCAECAFKAGYSGLFGNSFSLNHIMPDLERAVDYQVHCPKCNSTFENILTDGKLGCSECYNAFQTELLPTIEKIHGKAIHIGKRPMKYRQEMEEYNTLEELKEKINKAIEIQDFETAAVIRDEIKKLEGKE